MRPRSFYDDWVVERWRRWLADGRFHDLPYDITGLANAAGERTWHAVSPAQSVIVAREAAEAVTSHIAALPSAALQDAVAGGRLAMIDRSWHWDPHMDDIRRGTATKG